MQVLEDLVGYLAIRMNLQPATQQSLKPNWSMMDELKEPGWALAQFHNQLLY